MDCYLCENESVARCPRCGRAYCADHGDDLCAYCLDPANAAPSGTFFRVTLLGLLLGSVLALWLLVRPPGLPGESSGVIVPETSPLASPAPITPGAVGSPTPTPTPEPVATPTPTPPPPTPTPTPEPPPPEPADIEYTVVDGDTWYGLADAYGIDAEQLAAYNGLTLDYVLQVGDVILIPQ